MSSILSGLAGVAEKSAGEALAFGLGFALGRALEPAGVGLAQTAWDVDPNKVLDAGSAAAIVAEAVDAIEWGEGEARQTGINKERFDLLVQEALEAPGFAELITMLRRESILEPQFKHGLRKHKLPEEWDVALEELATARLDPAVVAAGIVRGLIADPGILPVGPPSAVGRVPRFPVFNVDALAEAKAAGLDRDRLAVMVGNYGRPMSPEAAAAAVFRDLIDRVDFDRAISEGDVRNEWAEAIFEHARAILSPVDYVAAFVRDWIDEPAMIAGAAKHGMSAEDADLLFKIHGRPLSWHQVWIGLRRGGVYDGPTDQIDPAFLKSLRESDVRPEWYDLAWAQRFTYPAAFVLRALTQSGDVTQAEALEILLFEGWEPKLAEKVAARWAGGTGAAADPHVTKAQGQLWTALHKSYVASETDAAGARVDLTAIGVADTSQAAVLALWDRERELVRAGLTEAQIKKAAAEGKFTRDEALKRLTDRGLSAADAATVLDT